MSVGQCEVDCSAFLHIAIQHEHSPGEVFIHQCIYEAYKSVLGAVVWTVLTRVELAVCVQALQRRAHAPRVTDCKRFNLVIRHAEEHKCGLKSFDLRHPFELVVFTDAASNAQPGEPIGCHPWCFYAWGHSLGIGFALHLGVVALTDVGSPRWSLALLDSFEGCAFWLRPSYALHLLVLKSFAFCEFWR